MTALNNVQQLNEYVSNYTEDFFIDIESNGSKRTESQYRSQIGEFIKETFGYELKYLTKSDLQSIDTDYLISYFNNLYKEEDEQGNKKYMNSTINNKMSAVKSFIKYMDFRRVIEFKVSDLTYIKNKKKDSVSHETVPMDVVFAMIEDIQLNESNLTTEKNWFMKIAVETGLRANDVLSLEQKQFTILPDGKHVMIQSRGSNKSKGNKDWKEMIGIGFYNEIVENLFNAERENLFTISASTIAKMMNRSQERLGIDRGYTPHSLKRTAVNNTRAITNDLKAAQVKGKHSSSTTTDIYLDEVEYGATGYFSTLERTDTNLMNEVSHEALLEALNGLDDNTKLLINIKLQEKINK